MENEIKTNKETATTSETVKEDETLKANVKKRQPQK